MILSCAEVHFDNPVPSYKEWIVGTTPSESLEGILQSCRKIPKLHDRIGDWECVKLQGAPIEGSDDSSWRIKAWFSNEPAITEAADDEPHFPPYDGPKGQQPDGSFVLTPRCWHYLHQAMLWSTHWGIGAGGDSPPPGCMAGSSMKDFWSVLCEETVMDMETYT